MALPPFPNIKGLSDYDAGALLLGYFIAEQADMLGIPPNQIPEEFAEKVRQHVMTLEAATAKVAAVEKALHKAASGDFETAGRLLREHMVGGAIAMRFVPIGINKSRQAKNFGIKGAKTNKELGEVNRQAVLDEARTILAERERKPTGRELADLISTRIGMPYNTVRGHLKKLRDEKILD